MIVQTISHYRIIEKLDGVTRTFGHEASIAHAAP
jgi:hypothetical protein